MLDAAPTSLGDIRRFLDSQGDPLPPWSSGEQALDALHARLAARRADPAFWAALAPLLRRLQDRRVRPELVRGGEVLDGARVEELLEALRESLAAARPGGARAWARGGPKLRAVAGFALLGAAAACDGEDKDSAVTCYEATTSGVTDAAEVEVYCALVDLIRDAELSEADETRLLECLPAISAPERAALLEMFTEMDEDELARQLVALSYDSPCYEDTGGGGH